MWRRPVALVNARVWLGGSVARSIRFSTRVLAVDTPPLRGDVTLDLDGAWVLPGLINAHDHLELNHFGLLKFKDSYANASEWIDDMRPRLRTDPAIVAGLGHSLADRLLVGGLKNVLSGATTVAHHNPLYPELRWRFPANVVRDFGWAHSFALEGQPVGARGEKAASVAAALDRTPSHLPFMLHLAEGVDDDARAEFDRFAALGGLERRSVLVHAVALTPEQHVRARRHGVGLVWCPASNIFLFGSTVQVDALFDAPSTSPPRVALGTDARITGSLDLLDELRCAAGATRATPAALLDMVTAAAADLLGLDDVGTLRPGSRADLCVVPANGSSAAESLLAARRADLLLVTLRGRPVIAEPRCAPIFEPRRTVPHAASLDGQDKVLDSALARRIARASLREAGLEIERT